MSCAIRLAAATAVVVLIAPPVIAKPACDTIHSRQAIQAATTQAANTRVGKEQCSRTCLSQTRDAAARADDVPGPAHLPVVSPPDEIASWHAEIFDHLSQGGDNHTLCKLDI